MTKVVVCSDNHGNAQVIKDIINNNQDADLFLHCGDFLLAQDSFPQLVIVSGNNDYYGEYPFERIIHCGEYKILITHSHQFYGSTRLKQLAKHAKELDCQIVCFGHTHTYYQGWIDGVLLVNPGSCVWPRNSHQPSYAVMELNEKEIIVHQVLLNRLW